MPQRKEYLAPFGYCPRAGLNVMKKNKLILFWD
jgi:hypothetical protein